MQIDPSLLLEHDAPRSFYKWLLVVGKKQSTASAYESLVRSALKKMIAEGVQELTPSFLDKLTSSTTTRLLIVWPTFERFCRATAQAAAEVESDKIAERIAKAFGGAVALGTPAQLATLPDQEKLTGARLPKFRLPYAVLWAVATLSFNRQGRKLYLTKRVEDHDKQGRRESWYDDTHIATVRWTDVRYRDPAQCLTADDLDRWTEEDWRPARMQSGVPKRDVDAECDRLKSIAESVRSGRALDKANADFEHVGTFFLPGVIIFVRSTRDPKRPRREVFAHPLLEYFTMRSIHATYLSTEQSARAVSILYAWGAWAPALPPENAPLVPVAPRSYKPIPPKALVKLLDEYDPQLEPMPTLESLEAEMREMGFAAGAAAGTGGQ